MKNEKSKRYYLFSNGTEFMLWTGRNCDECFKASRYNEKTDTFTKYRCAIQKHIDEAFLGDGCGSKRDHDATHRPVCPYKQSVRPQRIRREKVVPNQMTFNF